VPSAGVTTEVPAASSTPLTRYAWLSIAAAVVVLLFKLAAWWLTGSVSMLSDALESLANVAAACIALASLVIAARPADEDHAYGHSKAEYFAGGVEGGLIITAAIGIAWAAVLRLFQPQPLSGIGAGLTVSTIASLINLVVARILLKVGRERRSPALEADAKHLFTDVWTSATTLAAVIATVFTGWLWLDPVFGLLLVVHIVATGVRLIYRSALGLMDTAIPPHDLGAIRQHLDSLAAEGLQYHALRTRQAGTRCFMSFHLLVPGAWSVQQAHDRAETLEDALRSTMPRLNIVTHIEPIEDPVSHEDTRLDRETSPASSLPQRHR
jgi:cation diffusion facilitator family transporter